MSTEIPPKNPNAAKKVWLYYKNAIQIYGSNFKNFFLVGLLASFFLNLIEWLSDLYFEENLGLPVPEMGTLSYKLVALGIRLLIGFFTMGFYGAILGMGYDIMSSGDEYAPVAHFFYYLRKYWIQFFIFGLIINLSVYLLIPFTSYKTPWNLYISLNYFAHGIQFIIYFFFYLLNPTVMFYSNMQTTITHTRQKLKKEFWLILLAYLIYYILFVLPLLTKKFISFEIQSQMAANNGLFDGSLFGIKMSFSEYELTRFTRTFDFIFWFWRFIVGFPFLSIVSLRINNEYIYKYHAKIQETV